jgi:hypothetical protein
MGNLDRRRRRIPLVGCTSFVVSLILVAALGPTSAQASSPTAASCTRSVKLLGADAGIDLRVLTSRAVRRGPEVQCEFLLRLSTSDLTVRTKSGLRTVGACTVNEVCIDDTAIGEFQRVTRAIATSQTRFAMFEGYAKDKDGQDQLVALAKALSTRTVPRLR